MKKLKRLHICVVIAILIPTIILATVALTTWYGSITWELQSKQFSVWDSPSDGTELTSPWLPPLLIIPSYPHTPLTYNFWLENNGNVEITVTVTETTELGCIGDWDKTSYIIPKGSTRVLATLTLTITGDGSYDFEFKIG